jgi:hypothetical protein
VRILRSTGKERSVESTVHCLYLVAMHHALYSYALPVRKVRWIDHRVQGAEWRGVFDTLTAANGTVL